MADYYKVLGISRKANEKEIRQAFRRLARKYHPDLRPSDRGAEKKFKEINEANAVLSDPTNRKNYDRYGDKWKYADQIEAQNRVPFGWTSGGRRRRYSSRAGHFSNVDDLLGGVGNLFGSDGSESQSPRVEASVKVSLEEAFAGAKRRVTISSQGKNRRIEVKIPPGVDTGSVVRVMPSGGHELLLNVTIVSHKLFTRNGDDLISEVDVAMEDTILGGEVVVRTLDSMVRVKVPPESQNGRRIRLAGQGMPKLGSKDVRGDLFIVIRPNMPKGLTEDELELIRRFKALRSSKTEK